MPLDSLSTIVHNFEQQPRWQTQHRLRRVLNHWNQIVGQAVACQAIPVRLERQILYVAVANPMWAQTLNLEKPTILDKINRQLSVTLNDIRFSSGDWFQRPTQSRLAQTRDSEVDPNIPEWLQNHPSFVNQTTVPITQSPPTKTALESFQQWSGRRQQLNHHQPSCPVCRCHCPEGELRRWSKCSICAAHSFSP